MEWQALIEESSCQMGSQASGGRICLENEWQGSGQQWRRGGQGSWWEILKPMDDFRPYRTSIPRKSPGHSFVASVQ